MLVEFPHTITTDNIPIAKNIKLNIDMEHCRLRLKAIYIINGIETPVDLVVFKWTPKLDKLCLAIVIDGTELISKTDFKLKISYDVIKRYIKLTGTINGREVKSSIKDFKDFMEIPKIILGN